MSLFECSWTVGNVSVLSILALTHWQCSGHTCTAHNCHWPVPHASAPCIAHFSEHNAFSMHFLSPFACRWCDEMLLLLLPMRVPLVAGSCQQRTTTNRRDITLRSSINAIVDDDVFFSTTAVNSCPFDGYVVDLLNWQSLCLLSITDGLHFDWLLMSLRCATWGFGDQQSNDGEGVQRHSMANTCG